MQSHPRISELLVETKAYTDLEQPVILTSGELGIYYINTEKLVQDGGKFDEFGDNSQAMIKHAIEMTKQHPTFGEVIDILSEKAKNLLQLPNAKSAISGGQRRDWLFSGPVAYQLGIPHISLYKNGVIESIGLRGGRSAGTSFFSTRDAQVLHIADLLTEASSCYRIEDKVERGWIPMIRGGAKINDLIAIVTRCQGGEETLKRQHVTAHPFVAIDENFLKQYSSNPERAVAYMQSPREWSENYLRENGALALVKTFDPEGGKLDRAKKFLDRYGDVLVSSGAWEELDYDVQNKFGKSLRELAA